MEVDIQFLANTGPRRAANSLCYKYTDDKTQQHRNLFCILLHLKNGYFYNSKERLPAVVSLPPQRLTTG
jgi:hypothetical protein